MRPRSLLVLLVVPTLFACVPRDDGYLLLRRRELRNDGEPTQLAYARTDDAAALQVRPLLADGFGAELLRTYAMARRLVGRGSDPAIIAFGSEDTFKGVPYRERQFDGGWFRQTVPPNIPIAWIDVTDETAMTARLTTALAGAIVDTVVGTDPPAPPLLREGYATFLTVVAGEWSAPAAIDEREQLRALPGFADVRANTVLGHRGCGVGVPGTVGPDLNWDPILAATVLHRLASSEAGRRMAPAEIYRPLLAGDPPHGIHPALLLGSFRNFQAKLLIAWREAVTAGRPPADMIDLLEAYAAHFPQERPALTRIAVISTYGGTGRYEPIPERTSLGEMERLTAEVLFGRQTLRDAVAPIALTSPTERRSACGGSSRWCGR